MNANGLSNFIIAQASSGLTDFLQQLPVGLILMFCGSGVLLVTITFMIIRARTRRDQPPASASLVADPVPPATASSSAGMDDLPDLDLLVNQPPVPRAPEPAPAPAPAPAPVPTPAAPAPARTTRRDTFSVSLADGGTAQAVEVVTILRDVVDGSLIVQMGDRAFRDLSRDETFRNNFLKVMREFSPVVKNAPRPEPKSTPDAAAPAPPRPQAYEAIPQPEQPEAPEPSDEDSAPHSLRDLLVAEELPSDTPAAPPLAPPPPAPGGIMPGDLPRFSLEDEPQVVKKRAGLLGRQKTEFVPVPELNLAEAIETYLQHKLNHTPQYEGRSIHVHSAPDGGVAIEVDGVFYDSVGDVTDADVRAFLSATIQEWQARNTRT